MDGKAIKFQSTRPVRGATVVLGAWQRAFGYFNPRAPCGARHHPCTNNLWQPRFQSTRPVRGATCAASKDYAELVFQSTRPVRGATHCGLTQTRGKGISIHAPRAGRDHALSVLRVVRINFNPRAPCGARLGSVGAGRQTLVISIHAPRAGRDHGLGRGRYHERQYFNPRAPCGARPGPLEKRRQIMLFQSTRPVRGATQCCPSQSKNRFNFNPRAPCGARRHATAR